MNLADSQKVSNFAALYDTPRNWVNMSINNQNLFRQNASIQRGFRRLRISR